MEEQDPLIQRLHQLQQKLASVAGIWELNGEFLKPFCDVVLSDETSGPVTGMAISSVEKFIAYGMLDPTHPSTPSIVESVSDAITHARFVGTNQTSDEVVLMKIVEVLHTILGAPVGRLLSNESVCELMQSCFRICFEMRLSELLRCFAETKLLSMVQMLFSCLHTLSEEAWGGGDDGCSVDQTLHCEEGSGEEQKPVSIEEESHENKEVASESPSIEEGEVGKAKQTEEEGLEVEPPETTPPTSSLTHLPDKHRSVTPYGLPCVRELLRFLISIINSRDRHNSESLITIGLNLVGAALEYSGPVMCRYQSLLLLIQDGLCKNLSSLLQHDSFAVYSRALKNCYLLFTCARQHLKLQLEMFLNILIDLISPENSKCPLDRRELALECILQLCNLPHFIAEVYVNFDCQLYMSNVFENLTKVLSKNAFQMPSGLTAIHIMSLEALYSVMTTIQDGYTPVSFSEDQLSSQPPPPSYQADSTSIVSARSLSPPLYKGEGPSNGHVVVEVKEWVGPPPLKVLQASCQKKKIISVATDLFNKKASSGVEYLVKQGIFSSPPDAEDVASFLHDNQGLQKAMIGDYIGDRRNIDVLNAYVGRFTVSGVNLVESLRHFLEAFRLPSESPIIARILETFTEHWLKCNERDLGKVFANKDAVFVLAYSIIMLNVVLHSTKVKESMTLQEYIHNQRKTNGGADFPPEYLTEVYNAIKKEEIIMPEEHTGAVKENYRWKILLTRSQWPEAQYWEVTTSEYDQDIFLVAWGPTVAALSYVFDIAEDKNIVQKAISGFSKCASIAAHYELTEVFDNLIISLCKFTTLLTTPEPASSVAFAIGINHKIRLSILTLFMLAHRHGNILREGWKNILDCLVVLYKAKLLPESLVEVEDFVHPSGKRSLFQNEVPSVRSDASIFSSLFWWSSSDSQTTSRSLTPSEVKARKVAVKCIEDCHPEQLFSESKFLCQDALQELIKALTDAVRDVDACKGSTSALVDRDSAVFLVELLASVAMENKDRIGPFWDGLCSLLTGLVTSTGSDCRQLQERAVVSLIRLSARLMGRPPMVSQVLRSIQVALPLPQDPPTSSVHKQLAFGLHHLILSQAACVKKQTDWSILFSILQYSGTGIIQSDSPTSLPAGTEPVEPVSIETGSVVTNGVTAQQVAILPNRFSVLPEGELPPHNPEAFFKLCESLTYLVRSDHHVSASNFGSCVRCVRTFAEVSAHSRALQYDRQHVTPPTKGSGGASKRGSVPQEKQPLPSQPPQSNDSSTSYTTSSLQLLDLLDTLCSKVVLIYSKEILSVLQPMDGKGGLGGKTPGPLWHVAWCPLLLGMAHMCYDSRKSVRQTGITYLQRALLAHDLQNMSACEWEACYTEVLFPMLNRLLEDGLHLGHQALEETRVRASNILCKVFLQHLPALAQLASFGVLWMEILNVMDKCIHLENCDLLYEAIPESLKNMVLVMVTQGVFDMASSNASVGTSHKLWVDTWSKVDQFLPGFLQELFPRTAPPAPLVTMEMSTPSSPPPPPLCTTLSPQGSPQHYRYSSSSSPPPPCANTPQDAGHSETVELMTYPVIIHPPLPSLPVPPVAKATNEVSQTAGFVAPVSVMDPRMMSVDSRQEPLVPSPSEGVYTI